MIFLRSQTSQLKLTSERIESDTLRGVRAYSKVLSQHKLNSSVKNKHKGGFYLRSSSPLPREQTHH